MKKYKRKFKMCFNSIENRQTDCLLEEPAVIMSKETGSPRKLGNYTSLEKYFKEKLYNNAENYELIKFNMAYPELGFASEGYNFTPSELSTALNRVSECLFNRISENDWDLLNKTLKPIEDAYTHCSSLQAVLKQLANNKAFLHMLSAIVADEAIYKEIPKRIRRFTVVKDACYLMNYKVAKYFKAERYAHCHYISVLNYDNEVAQMHESYLTRLAVHKAAKRG